MNTYIFLLFIVIATLISFNIKTVEGGNFSEDLENLKKSVGEIDLDQCSVESKCKDDVVDKIKEKAKEIIDQIGDVNNNIASEKSGINDKIATIQAQINEISTDIEKPPGLEKINLKVEEAKQLHREAKQSYENMASLYSCKQNEMDDAKCQGNVNEAEENVMKKLKELLNDRCDLENAGVDPKTSDVDPDTMKELLKFFSNAKCKSGADKTYSAAIDASKKHDESMGGGSGGKDVDMNALYQKLMEGSRDLGAAISGVEEMMNAKYVADGGKCQCDDDKINNTIKRSHYDVMIDPKKTEYCTVKKRNIDTTSYDCYPLIEHEDKIKNPNTYRICYNCKTYPVTVFNDSRLQSFLSSNENQNNNIARGLGVGTQGTTGMTGNYGMSNGTPFYTNKFYSLTDSYNPGPPGYSQTMDLNNNPS